MRSSRTRRNNGQFAASWEKKVPMALLTVFLAVSLPFYIAGTPEQPLFSQPEPIYGFPQKVRAVEPTSTPTPAPTPGSLEDKIRAKFGKDGELMVRVAFCESGIRENAVGDHKIAFTKNGKEYGRSYGVFQIRHLPGRPDPSELLDADTNIEIAYKMYKSSGLTPWVTCGKRARSN